MSSRGGEETAGQRRVGYGLLVVAMGLAALIQVVSTKRGIGLVSDSATYLQGAQILAHHPAAFFSLHRYGSIGGFSHYPPLYSQFLAIPGWFGFGLQAGARWMNLLCLELLMVGVFALVVRRSGVLVAGIVCASLAVLGEFVYTDFSWAMSEALFLLLVVAALVLMDRAWDATGGRYWALIAGTGVMVGLSGLTRFIGIGLVGGAMVVVLLFGPEGRRLASAGVVAALGLVPVASWQVLDGSSGGGARTLSFYSVGTHDITRAGTSVGGFFLPERLVDPLQDAWVAAIVAAFVWAAWFAVRTARQATPTPAHRMVSAVVLGAAGITAMVLLGRLFYDPAVLFERRYFSAFAVAVVIAASVLLAERWRDGRTIWRVITAGVALVMVVGALPRTAHVTRGAYSHGIGYQSPAFRQSPTLAYVRRLGASVPVYSNAPDLVYLLLGRSTGGVPYSGARGYRQNLAAMRAALAHGHGVLVYINVIERSAVPGPQQALPGAVLVKRFGDGSVYATPRTG